MILDLPDVVLRILVQKIDIRDIVNFRLACKRLRSFSDELYISELTISKERNFKYYSYLDKKIIDFYNSVDVTTFKKLRSPFLFKSRLKKLFISFETNPIRDSILDYLNTLEHLEILGFNDKLYIVRLPSLRFLRVHYTHSFIQMTLETPKLENLHCHKLSKLVFSFPDTVKQLRVYEYDRSVTQLKNLEVLEVFQQKDVQTIHKDILTHLTNLKELKIDLDFEDDSKFSFFNYEFFKNNLIYIQKQKKVLKRTDLKIYLAGVRIDDNRSKIEEYDSHRDNLRFQIQNYNQLANYLTDESINYSILMNSSGHRLRNDIFLKYPAIASVEADTRVEDQKYFISFLKSLELLEHLELKKTELDQEFYEQLTLYFDRKLTLLAIEESSDRKIDFKFILKLKSLKFFATNLQPDQIFDLAIKSIQNLKKLIFFNFEHNEKSVQLTCLPDSTYRLLCKGKNGYLVNKDKLDLNQLIAIFDHLKGVRIRTRNKSDFLKSISLN